MPPDLGHWSYFGSLADRGEDDLLATAGRYHLGHLLENECLFLLGNPGAGKSSELKQLCSSNADELRVLIPCKELCGDMFSDIKRELDLEVRKTPGKPVRLILDGLDEGFLRNSSYFGILKRTLSHLRGEYPHVRLIMSCRPAEWDRGFGEAVNEMWRRNAKAAVFVLEPLSHGNQKQLIEHWGVNDAREFFAWVTSRRFGEFAAWPRSLEWMAREFKSGQRDAYSFADICRRRVLREFGENKRLSEADRASQVQVWSNAIMLLAGVLMFSGHKAIALDGGVPGTLALTELFAGSDRLSLPNEVALTPESVWDAVRHSHLMEERGGYHQFANQSDMEFLAVSLLAKLKVQDRMELLGCPDKTGAWRVFPQLAAIAALLAAQSPELFQFLVSSDPRVLLRADFSSRTEKEKKVAIDAILKATAKAEATGGHDAHAFLSTLVHHGIANQLHPWVFGEKKSICARELAFDMALACCNDGFWDDFEKSAAAKDEFAVAKLPNVIQAVGKNWSDARLKQCAESENLRVVGASIMALLDRGIPMRDLVRFLREPVHNVIDAYYLLLGRLEACCTTEDVAPVLEHMSKWRSVGAHSGPVRELAVALVKKGIAADDRADIRRAAAIFLVSRFLDDDHLLRDIVFGLDSPDVRRRLLIDIAECWPDDAREELTLYVFPVRNEDYFWLLETLPLLQGTTRKKIAGFVAPLASRFDESLASRFETTYAVTEELRARLPKPDDSGIFATLRRLQCESEARYRTRMEKLRQEVAQEHQRPVFDCKELMADSVEKCRAGLSGAWVNVCFALSNPRNERDGVEFFRHSDPVSLPGWTEASEQFRCEMYQFARAFLLHCKFPVPGKNSVPFEFFGFAYALTLLRAELSTDPELKKAIHPVWAAALLRHTGADDCAAREALTTLSKIAPMVVAEACEQELQEAWDRNGVIHNPRFDDAWNPAIAAALSALLRKRPIQPEPYLSGLQLLQQHDGSEALGIAIENLSDQNDPQPPYCTLAACLFVVQDAWENAWPLLVSDRDRARKFLLNYSPWLVCHHREKITELPPALCLALYSLMIELFPLCEAPRRIGTYTSTPLDDAYTLRGKLQSVLEEKGLSSELSATYLRHAETNRAWWARASVDRATQTAHALQRTPPTPAEFIKFLTTEGSTFVSDNDSLQRAVLRSLNRFEQNLRPNGLHALWEKGNPRSEDVFQSELVRHLRQDFEDRRIVVNRETKILQERSDIRVEAGDGIAVTIEVKLGHSKDRKRPLTKSMQTQLLTYLENQIETHGIFVVGWFFCPNFPVAAKSTFTTITSAQRFFDAQAKRLSKNGYSLKSCVLDCSWPVAISKRSQVTAREQRDRSPWEA